MIFVDINNDEKRNNNEIILQLIAEPTKDESLNWKASGSKKYLRFKADGSTRNQNGRLTYCLEKNGELYARQIIIYRSGRARRATEEEATEKC